MPMQRILTVTDKSLQRVAKPKYLVDRPQRLGMMPTWWFWNDRDNWRLVRAPFAMLAAVAVVAVNLLDLPIALAAIVASAAIFLAMGVLERFVRRKAKALSGESQG